jgi:hypothetical protein
MAQFDLFLTLNVFGDPCRFKLKAREDRKLQIEQQKKTQQLHASVTTG